jgi:glycosyltransferase involved in cell wall biosynthesis
MKIAFIHPALMDYRIELFNKINSDYETKFIFTKQGRGQQNVKEEHENIPSQWVYKNLKSNLCIKNVDIGMQIRLIKEIMFGDYDLVITSTNRYVCWIAARISNKKFMQLTEFWLWIDYPVYRIFLNKLNRIMSRNSDSIFAMGTKSYESYLEMGVNPNKIIMYPQCSLDYSNKPTENFKKSFHLTEYKVILFLGRLVRLKGVQYLMRAFSRLEKENADAFLIIAGDGPMNSELKKIAADLNIQNILFTGAVAKKNIASYYELCDVFVLPSIIFKNAYEPWGLVVNEAMAFGKPVITTFAVGSGKDFVLDGYNGFIVEDKNEDELFHSLKYIISNSDLALQMGLRSKTIFNKLNNIDQFYSHLKEAIEITKC